MISSRLLIAIALVAVFAVATAIKLESTTSQPFYDGNNGDGFFWTEAAFHFRHCRLISQGEAIPAVDKHIQFPEGLDTRRFITPVMEHVYGRVHRCFFSDVPLHRFLVWATAVFSSVSVFACFVAAYAVRPSGWIALMCASLYAFVPGSMYRNIATFIREDFALPFLFGSYACFLMCLKEDRRSVASMGAVLLFIALAAWHVSQFFIQLFAVGLVLLIVFHGFQILPRRALAIYTVAMVAASITLPVLREKTFVFSIPLMMCYPIVGLAWLRPGGDGWPAWKRIATAGGAMLVFVLIALSIQWFTGTHSHVYAVMLAKLRYLGQLPEDPTLLSFQAKMMWTSSFLTLSWREIWILYSSTLIFAAIALVAVGNQLLRGQHGPSLTMTLYLAAVTFVLAILINRMTIFAVFFLAVSVVFAWPRERRSWRFACGALLVVCLTCEVLRYTNSSVLPSFQFVPVRPEPVAVNEITRYLRTHTNSGQAVLTTIELSPHIAEYADRPVVIHSKFESPGLRKKVEEVYQAFYDDELRLYQVCKKYNASYFVYQSNLGDAAGPSSFSHIVGHAGVPTSSVVFAFHFAPERLKHFQLVKQNPLYRVFRVVDQPIKNPERPPYEISYDLGVFVQGDPGDLLTVEQFKRGWERFEQLRNWTLQARELTQQGRVNEVRPLYKEMLRLHPRYPTGLLGMYESQINSGHIKKAAQLLAVAMEVDPRFEPKAELQQDLRVLAAQGLANAYMGNLSRAEAIMRQAQKSGMWQVDMFLGDVLSLAQKYEEAESQFQAALRKNPQSALIYANLGRNRARQKKFPEAIEALENSLELNPNQPAVANFLANLRKLAETPDGH